jgi:hypothetical protein
VKTPEEKQRELAAWHTEWERKWRHTVVVDETYAHDGQYAETIADMSASAEAETVGETSATSSRASNCWRIRCH